MPIRNMKTQQERRYNEALMTDPEIIEITGRFLFVRSKRLNIPTSWEDKWPSNDNSWKRHRLTQYK